MDPRGKVAVVTGAAGGIGRASALRFAQAGARLLLADLDEDGCEETARLVRGRGGTARVARVDVSSHDDVGQMVALAEAEFGGLDILHNNAGVLSGPRFPDSAPECWRRALDVNVVGVLSGIHHAVPALRRRGGGVVVNTASISGLVPHLIDPVYAATKAAVVNLTRSLVFLRAEAGIRVNCVCPGLVRTGLEASSGAALPAAARAEFERRRTGLRKLPALDPEEVAEAALLLVEDDGLNGAACVVLPGEPLRME